MDGLWRWKRYWLPRIAGALILAAPFVLVWITFSTLNRLTDVFGESMGSDAPTLWPLLARSLGLGVLAMAAIQVVRSVYPLRALYHEWLLRRWFTPGLRAAPPASDAPWTSVRDAYLHFLSIVTASDRRTFLDLPIEQLCGQIAAAAEQVIEQASARRPTSLPTAPQGTDPRELAKLVLYGLAGDTAADEVGALVKKSDEPSHAPAKDMEDTEYVRLRNAVTLRVQRNIDGLQIWGGLWWRRILRCSAILLCGLLAWGLSGRVEVGDTGARAIFAITHAVLGGFLAMVTRDMVAVVEKARK